MDVTLVGERRHRRAHEAAVLEPEEVTDLVHGDRLEV